MKTILISIFFLILLSPSIFAQLSGEETLSKLNWLEGRWERVLSDPNQTGYEEWERMNNVLQGLGITIQQGDTVFKEKLSIEMIEGDLYYVADVNQNTEPTYFKITEIMGEGFVSENPDHDFPKMIEYQLSANGELSVVISGDGRSVPFVFRKE